MINSFNDHFIDQLRCVNASNINICVESAIIHINEQQMFYNTVVESSHDSENDSNIKDDLKNIFNTRNIFKAIWKALDLLSKLIRNAIKLILSIFKKFMYIAKDTEMNNDQFAKKYFPKLREIGNVTVEINGYKMNANMVGLVTKLESGDVYKSFNDAKSIIIDNKRMFNSKDAVFDYVSSTRSSILDNMGYYIPSNSLSNDKQWHSEFKFALYGEQSLKTYSVNEAMNYIKGYDNDVKVIKHLVESSTKNAERELNDLENLKKLASNNANTNTDIIEQLNMLSKYRNIIMQDLIFAHELIMEYVNKMNSQAKSICIKALQDN